MKPITLSSRSKAELLWYFGYGVTCLQTSAHGALIEQRAVGVWGSGCSVGYPSGPSEETLARAGFIGTILASVGDRLGHVLAIAYGDPGFIATDGGRLPDNRFRSVAHLTKTAIRMGAASRRELDSGNAAQRWLERQWARGAKRTKEISSAERQARALLDEAEIAYELASRDRHRTRKEYYQRLLAAVLEKLSK